MGIRNLRQTYNTAMNRLKDWLSRTVATAGLYLMRLRVGASFRGHRWLRVVNFTAVTAVGLALSSWVALAQTSVSEDLLSRLYLAAGALIGTIVVLAVNLSLIPIQKAAEQYAPSILRIFREDRSAGLLIIVLASISVLLFTLGVAEHPNPATEEHLKAGHFG